MTNETKELNNRWIVCAGSIHYDIFIESSRLPELGETLPAKGWFPKFGGKGGNQALAAANHGAKVRLLSAVGDDSFSGMLRKTISDARIDDDFVLNLQGPTGVSVAISNGKGDYGAVTATGVNSIIPLEKAYEPSLWSNAGILVLQNEFDATLNQCLAEEARGRGLSVVMNVSPSGEMSEELAEFVDIAIFNALEAQQFTGQPVKSLGDAFRSLDTLGEYFSTVIVTAGAEGVAVRSDRSGSFSIKGIPVNAKNAHGAGDVFAGTLCAELIKECDLADAAEIANKVASSFVAGNYGHA
ncbi:MAG: PfkB family carbohydrate kinase [Albidovulum sp.]|nr:PfkB family carbohydrate kinase [Albidovulum sp.]